MKQKYTTRNLYVYHPIVYIRILKNSTAQLVYTILFILATCFNLKWSSSGQKHKVQKKYCTLTSLYTELFMNLMLLA